MRKKTHEEFVEDLDKLTQKSYTLITKYQGMGKDIEVKHLECGYVYQTKPKNIIRTKKGNCPQCGSNTKKNGNLFQEKVKNLVGDEYTVIGNYKNNRTKIRIRHNTKKCNNHEYEVKPNYFLNGNRCPECDSTKLKSNDKFLKEVEEATGREYKFLEEYIGRRKPIKVRHLECGNIYKVTPGNFLSGTRCGYCNIDSQRLKKEDINARLGEVLGTGSRIVGDYKNNKIEVEIFHGICGNIFRGRMDKVLQGAKKCDCYESPKSKGEKFVARYLRNRGVEYYPQKTFKGLIDKGQLYYDFYLPEEGILIEYQGLHHFKPVRFGGISEEEARYNLRTQKIRDEIKRDYAKDNSFRLLEPTYKLNTYEKIEKYLDTEIGMLEVTQGTLNQKIRVMI